MNKTVSETPAEESAVDDEQAQADFDAGVAMEETPRPKTQASADEQPRDDAGRFASPEPEKKPEAKKKPTEKSTEKSAAKSADQSDTKPDAKSGAKPDVKPEYVQLTKQQFERLENAAKRTDDYEKQMSKAFGTIGDVQKIVRTLQGQTPRGIAVKIPDDAFAAMEKDFPELAQHTRAALEATLKGIEGTGNASAHIDPDVFAKQVEERVLKLAAEDLEDAYPDWQKIVGAVDVRKGEKPDPNNAFRKWLAAKPKDYQDRINGTNSAGVITRAIRAFKSETKTAPAPAAKPNAQVQARANRIREAVRPKGDGGHPPGKNADDEFEAGFRAG